MVYIPPVYPSTIPVTAGGDPDLPDRVDDVDWFYAARYNELKKELIAIMGELGTLPKGTFSDVKDRLDNIHPQYHYRGNPITHDWTAGDLSTDGAWHDLELASIIPEGTTAVALYVRITDESVGTEILFKRKGQGSDNNISNPFIQVADVAFKGDFIVPVDEDRKAEYKATNTTFSVIQITVKGWWK